MLRRVIKQYMPTPAKLKAMLKPLGVLGAWINNPLLWMINRQSISRATAIGLFSAYVPIPFEMLLAALLAWICRAYLPLSVALVWLSNPLTWVLLYTPPYLLGAAILGIDPVSLQQLTLTSITEHFIALWIGCLIFGVSLAIAGYILSRVIWRVVIARQWQNRHRR